MALLKDKDRIALRETFAGMTASVRLAFFTHASECETCDIVREILDEVAPLGEKISLVKYDYALDRDAVARYNIPRVPAIAVLRLEENAQNDGGGVERDYGIRLYGVPSGYEFISLIGALVDVSHGDSQLLPASRALLAQLTEPAHIQVFTTPT